jgi:hypothetical protein
MGIDVSAGTNMRKIYIYALGGMVLGLSQEWLKGMFDGAISFAIVICYCLLLRVVSEKWGKHE